MDLFVYYRSPSHQVLVRLRLRLVRLSQLIYIAISYPLADRFESRTGRIFDMVVCAYTVLQTAQTAQCTVLTMLLCTIKSI